MNKSLIIVVCFLFLTIPAWIRVIYFKIQQKKLKRFLTMLFLLLSTGFTFYLIFRPSYYYGQFDKWAKICGLLVYWIIALISAYFSFDIKLRNQTTNKDINKVTKKSKEYVIIPSIKGIEKEISFELNGGTFVKIGNTRYKYPDTDFGSWLIEAIYSNTVFLQNSNGFPGENLYCPTCGKDLALRSNLMSDFEFSLQYKTYPPFSIILRLPSCVCNSCNKRFVNPSENSLGYHLNQAIIDAFEKNNIRP